MNSRPGLILPRAAGSRVLAAILLAGIAATGATAQQVYTSGDAQNISISVGPPPAPQPLPRDTYDSGPSLGPSGRPPSNDLLPGQWFNHGDQGAWFPPDQNARRTPGPFFLPTLLPVLDAAPPANQAPLAANYPREFAGEPFFMAYGNLAAHHELSAKRVERIARYRTARLALLTELREQLSRAPDASALAGLATAQTPRLLELEAEAEKIRHDLTHGGLVKNIADDIGKLTTTDEAPTHRADLTSLRRLLSAAHFQDGFSSDQRRLLEEMALETQLVIEPEPATTNPASVFFWPAGVRISIPTSLPPEVAARFDEFQRRKATLKDELRADLDHEKARRFNPGRTEAHARLASAQTRRLAELDILADQLRPALAAQADATAALPADLGRQVAAIVERKAALQRELSAQLTEFRRELPAERIALSRQTEGLAIAIFTSNSSRHDREPVLARINEFNVELSARFTALATERDRVRADLARYLATAPGAKPGVTVDQFAADGLAAYHAQEARSRQRDYAAAVLTPGLSPAQRRLLLVAAAETLPESSSFAPGSMSSPIAAAER